MALDQQTKIQLSTKQNKIKYQSLRQIMIVDDDHELLEELKDFLSFDYEVETLFNSADAFDMACELRPDLIILDLKMSPKTGLQVAKELGNSVATDSIPIIAITGFDVKKEHALMMELFGIKRVITKPFSLHVLLEEVRAALKESRSHPHWA